MGSGTEHVTGRGDEAITPNQTHPQGNLLAPFEEMLRRMESDPIGTLREALQKYGPRGMIKAWDTNGDNKVSAAEMADVMAKLFPPCKALGADQKLAMTPAEIMAERLKKAQDILGVFQSFAIQDGITSLEMPTVPDMRAALQRRAAQRDENFDNECYLGS